MSKQLSVLYILGSSRPKGNTAHLISEVKSQIPGDVIDISKLNISFYDYEHKNIDDDFIELIENILESDLVCFASPVYWYSMSAQMKVFFDRLTDLLTVRKDLGRKLKGHKACVISTSETVEPPTCFEDAFKMTFEYFSLEYIGMLYCDYSQACLVDVIKEKVNEFIEQL